MVKPASMVQKSLSRFDNHDSRIPYYELMLEQNLATATAWYDIRKGDDGQSGWLHWVAVRRDAQGLGLSKPLITHALQKFEAVPDDELIRSENGG